MQADIFFTQIQFFEVLRRVEFDSGFFYCPINFASLYESLSLNIPRPCNMNNLLILVNTPFVYIF